MRIEAISIVGAAIVAVFAGVVGVGLLFMWRGRADLRHSVEVLLQTKLSQTYEIRKATLSSSESDLSGTWWLRVNGSAMPGSPFRPASGTDTYYYKGTFQRLLEPDVQLDSYALYMARVPLGEGTICEARPCDIAVLVKPGSGSLFVRISEAAGD